ncbi:hypothetical protein M430DRAFT_49329 [Amorphotheca resinae ATCC 22711]|uniref:Uncharacterized protein n=1 Tax=Amorphotheca resinae ATCC 22711 TaxID=857342 RepID=A0A2T3B5Z3_AMORE|nr:hypothetical protein M430DRAFT_49329 [Amorphotheca resinae ATCC 22711]PSS22177.1 hypothetical protein M430DRAFT_49329 [Amorphotheca resinae ATCC 22711]
MSQTMLLTKRLSVFLSQNTTPQLQTLLLLSPTGKLLCSASPSPASTLRTQATLACSLWNLYHPFHSNTSALVASALPASSLDPESRESEHDLSCITIQLEFGIMCIRALSSGLLFVAVGPSNISPSQFPSQHLNVPRHILSGSGSPPSSPAAHEGNTHGSQVSLHAHGEGTFSGAGSEAGSVGAERSTHASIWSVRRQAEEVGRLLEGRFEGFVLSSGEGR